MNARALHERRPFISQLMVTILNMNPACNIISRKRWSNARAARSTEHTLNDKSLGKPKLC